jgi:hypothetical protein
VILDKQRVHAQVFQMPSIQVQQLNKRVSTQVLRIEKVIAAQYQALILAQQVLQTVLYHVVHFVLYPRF